MPFCINCGTQVSETDIFCQRCGAKQRKVSTTFLDRLTAKNAALLCYIPVVGWIAAIMVLASPRFRDDRLVRFHAFQGLYLFVAWLLVQWVVVPFFGFPGAREIRRLVVGMLEVAVFAAWIVMLVKTSQDQLLRLPIIGELAERSIAEQH